MTQPSSTTEKGVRGFELDIHVAFVDRLPEAQAVTTLRVLDGFRVDLYRPHAQALHREPLPEQGAELLGGGVPSARLTGPLRDADAVRAGLAALLGGPARYVEVGVRGFLRSAGGQTEWMPWRRNRVLGRGDTAQVGFEEGVRYVLE
ncbi:hypothetical protein [Deinococcus wulumuqiensis]|uniref:Uncharacterized protein n=1 Tax=Deinococcus wulumuqiensis TaxID=980427 RepID=A0AAV4K778_9DEIO|nr:hypothetical protein [Deinococcus wulumuqiensis]QII20447.1 hypothetical protein G6R31_06515 [Deinococcus wulumuqiensis R12]GGI77611.1 hypothetical protein GCM10010914_09860 [Deinococcus wulumuqiensis]GGP28856.1 hypothetical protein GCM10008021_05070 [Deinococcus wulumuqiensis]